MASTVSPPFDEIAECKIQITEGKRRKRKVGDGQRNLAPSNEKDWQEIHFFSRVSWKHMRFAIQLNWIPWLFLDLQI